MKKSPKKTEKKTGKKQARKPRKRKLQFERIFTKTTSGKPIHPYDAVRWSRRHVIHRVKDKVIFEQKGVDAPEGWSDRAVFIAASKYFRGHLGQSDREVSIRDLFDRVVDTITKTGRSWGYFDKKNAEIFNHEIKALLVGQKAAFNSPVFFNVGAEEDPQGSACFILDIQDNLEAIAATQPSEIKVFSKGSGTGINLSTLREAGHPLSKGGFASGPMSFFVGFDAWAGAIRSGGILRRASKLNRLDIWHPDVYNGEENGSDFISFKAQEERKARALIMAGFSPDEACQTVRGQNANLSVGLTDDFMKAAVEGRDWDLKSVIGGKKVATHKANKILDSIVDNMHFCGDPGIQFHTTINEWNTTPKEGEILSSNPCGEFFSVPNSACNLASLNLMSFFEVPEGLFFEREFSQAVRLMLVAQDILVDLCGYPTEEITKNSRTLRPLGLNFANLGGLVMSMGLPYDSQEARSWAAAISALMTGTAFLTSSDIAEARGPFSAFAANKNDVLRVQKMHAEKVNSMVGREGTSVGTLLEQAREVWGQVLQRTENVGVRNSQVTLMAPTGTVALMMDCATSGIEPGFWLTLEKTLVDGGTLTMPLSSIPTGLDALGYEPGEKEKILEHIKENHMIEGSALRPDDLPVFDTAYTNGTGDRSISPEGHLLMIAAVQGFVSGGISNTIGCPEDATKESFRDLIIRAWKLGLKGIAVYRDGSKVYQPIQGAGKSETASEMLVRSQKKRLPKTRPAINHAFRLGPAKCYIDVGFYPEDRKVGEIFLSMAKQGSTARGLLEALSLAVSVGLQHQIPLAVYVEKMLDQKFDPAGWTGDENIRSATSIVDYVFRFLAQFDDESRELIQGPAQEEAEPAPPPAPAPKEQKFRGDICKICGSLMIRKSPTCVRCPSCINSEGSCGG